MSAIRNYQKKNSSFCNMACTEMTYKEIATK